ncbi:MAG: hypothetical protein IJB36_05190 [Clostridia bacterium]|nr:hypothetical protein [Clostridia bacterium]
MNEEKRPLPSPDDVELRANPVLGEPVDVWDQINKYGTYEVQDTTDTDNVFPTIGYEGSGDACVDAANKMIKKKPEL